MISIKKYLAAPDSEVFQALLRVVSLILEGLALHAVETSPAERSEFQDRLRRLARTLEAQSASPAGLLVTGGSILQTIELYHRHVARQFAAQKRELCGIVALLTSVVAGSCRGNERAVSNLRAIEQELESAAQSTDLHAIRLKLEECLTSVRSETERQAMAAASTRQALEAAISNAAADLPIATGPEDPVTGLPGRDAAMSRLESAASSGSPVYAVAFVIDSFHIINRRFGAQTSDEVALVVSQRIAEKLKGEDALFQWSNSAFLAVLIRLEPLEAVRAEIAHLAAARIEHTIDIAHRTVLLAISLSWMCLPAWQAPDVDSLAAQIDAFVLRRPKRGS